MLMSSTNLAPMLFKPSSISSTNFKQYSTDPKTYLCSPPLVTSAHSDADLSFLLDTAKLDDEPMYSTYQRYCLTMNVSVRCGNSSKDQGQRQVY